jgi:hypothetical protein
MTKAEILDMLISILNACSTTDIGGDSRYFNVVDNDDLIRTLRTERDSCDEGVKSC